MSTYTVSYPVCRDLVPDSTMILHCPKCHKPMTIWEMWKRNRKSKDRYEGAAAECKHGCVSEDKEDAGAPLLFYSYDLHYLKEKVHKYERENIIKRANNYKLDEKFERWADQLSNTWDKNSVNHLKGK